MNTNIITPPVWLQLNNVERQIMRDKLHIPRTGGTVVDGNKMVTDGCTQQDLLTITLSSLQKLLDSEEEDFFSLWHQAVQTVQIVAQEREKEERNVILSERIKEEEKNYQVTSGIMMNQIKKLPVSVQVLIYSELEAHLFPEIINTNIQTNEQNKSESNISGNEGTGEGDKETKRTSKK